MRSGGVLLLLAFLVAAVAAKDSATIRQEETNDDSTIAPSGVGKIGQHDETNPNTEPKVHEDRGFENDAAENNRNDNSTGGTSMRRDETGQQPKDKDNNTTKSSHVTECDPSHSCIIEKKKFIACLKVPGEDSLALSLLMDNKGVNLIDVSITAPDYVTLAEDTVYVEANGHNETKVSVSSSDASNNTVIVLKVAGETCDINIHRAITRATGRVIRMRLTSTYMLVPVFILLGMLGICIKLRRMRKQDSGPAYQTLDAAELPVSAGGKKEADQSDRWDDNWGDDWDDEEAPLTPSKPMPNPSSKGLASRRSTKDGWKD